MDHQLLVFMKVVEKANFSHAAKELHMTQPAVSQSIQILEKKYDTQLLERNNKRVALTKAGEIVYYHGKEIVSLYNRMNELIYELLEKAEGQIAVGASYTFGEYVLPKILASLKKKYPLIKPKITIDNTAEICEMVANQQMDIGIVEGNVDRQKIIITETIAKDYMYIITGKNHPFTKKKEITVKDLANEMWIVREDGSGTREATEKLFKMLNFRPGQLMECGSTQIIKEAVEAGLGISLLSRWAIKKEEQLKSLCLLNVHGLPLERDFSIIIRNSKFQTKATQLFIETLRNDHNHINNNAHT
ncbi:LysR family transcriptional regulator [Bacillus aquiflavi]|uniref:LysR family transcriptional regulator n=1 Tax=Bacillus aquiflavi TaxID=2672567 RepID=A0A6B3VQ87_9BACI|nr:LysR family transcriptional regulator [Bacillus aquiflavi]MBA4535743.1 LysR family transcriptional regulator [Bacillus aquiflavi]NEY80119.1 LysR family transcriptional regulator [Bacillus aquiflavi]UAC47990.1 LysR family transcriptional regulator [Bacillus aquiflavi]